MTPYLFILPTAILVLSVAIYPMLYALRISFYRSELLAIGRFVGLGNYRALFQDPTTAWNFAASGIFVLGSVALSLGLGLLLAILLNERLMFRALFRAWILIPWVVSQVVAALVWRWLVNADYGPVAVALLDLGLPRIDLLGDRHLAMFTLILANTWRSVAFPMVLFLAALQGIPENLYRAARVDGISRWLTFRCVTLPLIKPVVLVAAIILTLSYFNIIALPLVLTGGGPLQATELVSLRLYREAFAYYHVGLASAIAILMFLANMALTLFYLRFMRARGRA
ncbi:MAG: hypothetical protein A3G35_10335 [candidate division NC10 bacterium RIFCSPLOWO2_12_FULL_66_18]|nr:MAG: hypothetical protein A3H39_04370 [candidate division NC10 bacterium RIFCSPLOWO2_02_FULL_66_22]OGC02848.1 MAG: hypothetical protein A3G35_10335 [candidate division NC10 bacterium RIFCSPLOWO2_12_FULL_66_18]